MPTKSFDVGGFSFWCFWNSHSQFGYWFLIGSNENLFCKEVADNSKIVDLRGEVAKQVQKEPGQLVLIFGGKILKDEDTLETHNIKDNNSVHLVIKNQRQVREKIDLDPALNR